MTATMPSCSSMSLTFSPPAMHGGSTTAILIKTPGESASIVTSLEGNLMARRGRAAAALATAAIGSFVAGTLATIGITFLAPLCS